VKDAARPRVRVQVCLIAPANLPAPPLPVPSTSSPNLPQLPWDVPGCWPALSLSPACVAAATVRKHALTQPSTPVACTTSVQGLVSHCRVSCPCMQQCVDWPGSCVAETPLLHLEHGMESADRVRCCCATLPPPAAARRRRRPLPLATAARRR